MVTGARVLTLGETLGVAITPTGVGVDAAAEARLDVAGAESTVAIGVARLGVIAGWLGVLGRDALGDRVVRALRAEGVDTGAIRRDEAPTAFMLRERRSAGRTVVSYYRKDSAGSRLAPADVDAAFVGFEPTLVHLTGITPALSESAAAAVRRAAELAREHGVELSVDVNLRRTLPGMARSVAVVRELLSTAAVVFVGDDELEAVSDLTDPEAAAREIASRGAGEVVLKQGAQGAQVLTDGAFQHASAMTVDVVDVVGAGDAFVAGYLAARAIGLPVTDRLRWGTVAAAFTVGSPSDWQGLPTRSDLEGFDGGPTTRR